VACAYAPQGGVLNSTLSATSTTHRIGDRAANKASTPWTQSYLPSGGANNGSIGAIAPPINLYFNAQVKI